MDGWWALHRRENMPMSAAALHAGVVSAPAHAPQLQLAVETNTTFGRSPSLCSSQVLGKGQLPKQPVVVKAKFVSALAEKKIKAVGGAVVLTA